MLLDEVRGPTGPHRLYGANRAGAVPGRRDGHYFNKRKELFTAQVEFCAVASMRGPCAGGPEDFQREERKRSMRRQITDHITNPANDLLKIESVDEKGAGGAHHNYHVSYAHGATPGNPMSGSVTTTMIQFQNGPIAEAGVNGLTQEALLAIVIDRLRCFQGGPYSCRENAIALTKCEEALMWLQRRTMERMRRGGLDERPLR